MLLFSLSCAIFVICLKISLCFFLFCLLFVCFSPSYLSLGTQSIFYLLSSHRTDERGLSKGGQFGLIVVWEYWEYCWIHCSAIFKSSVILHVTEVHLTVDPPSLQNQESTISPIFCIQTLAELQGLTFSSVKFSGGRTPIMMFYSSNIVVKSNKNSKK